MATFALVFIRSFTRVHFSCSCCIKQAINQQAVIMRLLTGKGKVTGVWGGGGLACLLVDFVVVDVYLLT